jgi:hypothetical protein
MVWLVVLAAVVVVKAVVDPVLVALEIPLALHQVKVVAAAMVQALLT